MVFTGVYRNEKVDFGREYGFLVVFNCGRWKEGKIRTPHPSNNDDKTVYLFNITYLYNLWPLENVNGTHCTQY
jgi:hypothetical protein